MKSKAKANKTSRLIKLMVKGVVAVGVVVYVIYFFYQFVLTTQRF